MVDDPSGGPGSDDLELKPQWGTGGGDGENKPRHVAVRKEGDIAESMKPSAADDLYREESAEESVKVEKERRIGYVLVAILAVAVVAFAAWKILKVEVELQADVTSNYRVHKAAVVVKVDTSHDVQVRVEGHGDAKAVSPGSGEPTFEIPLDKLQLGENELTVQVVRNGSVLKERKVVAFRDFSLKIDKNKVANPPHPVYLLFQAADGWKIRFNGQNYEPDSKGVAKVKVSMKEVFENLGRFEDPNYEFPVPITVIRKNGDQFAHNEKVDIMLPQAALRLGIQADAIVTENKRVTIAGTTDPTATVTVAGKAVQIADNGTFSMSVKLPKSKKFRLGGAKDLAAALTAIRSAVDEGRGKLITIEAKLEGKVPSKVGILAIRAKAPHVKAFAKLAANAD